MADVNILRKLESLQIGDSDVSFTFSDRLARENDWTNELACRVVSEYKRFIYLASISDSAVTPSDSVDQAWHLHLTYTDSYWNDLCNDILNFDIHHNPTVGGPSQQQLFEKQYLYTLGLYESTFNEKPPQDIWPDVRTRFETADRFIRVNRSQAWIIPKPNVTVKNGAAIVLLPVVVAACGASQVEKGFGFWLMLVICALVLIVVILLAIAKIRASKNGSGGSSGKSGCGGGSGCGGCSGCGG